MTSPDAPIPMSLTRRILVASAWVVIALAGATFLGEQVQQAFGLSAPARQAFQALLTSALVVPVIWWLWTRVNGGEAADLGLGISKANLRALVVGLSIIAVPVVVIIAVGKGFGWASISIDNSAAGIQALLLGVGTIFFLEALPEELVVRGYIYRNLSGRYSRLKASMISVLLFVMLPVAIVMVQKYVFGLEIRINGVERIEPSFLVTLFVFGWFLQFLRVASGTIWVGIGFHTAFVLINRIMGPRDSQMIRFEEIIAPGPLKFVAIGTVVAVFGAVFAWPWLAKRSLGWREVDRETVRVG
jgi:membrane protease YdiL (CAAX protease family)